jgi:methyl coenzyme M reductase alpha subunit
MSDGQISESEVDSIVLALLELHSGSVQVEPETFMDLLKHSLSLNTMEKKRVVDAVPTLSQFQFDELTKVFTEEREKFRELAKDHPEDIKKLLVKQQTEWVHLGDLYRSELENQGKQAEDKAKEEEIKKSLGL